MDDDVKQPLIHGSITAVVANIACVPIKVIFDTNWPSNIFLLASVIAALICLFCSSRIEKKNRYFCYGLVIGSILMTMIVLLGIMLVLSIASILNL